MVDQWRSDSSLLVTSTDLQTALIRAGEYNHSTVVSYLLDQGVVIDQDVIMNAVSGTSEAVWQVLFDHGWDINSNGCTGAPALKYGSHIIELSMLGSHTSDVVIGIW